MIETAAPDDAFAPPTKVGRRHRLLVLVPVLAAALVVVSLLAWPSPIGPTPATLHIWGRDFNSTGDACEDDMFGCLFSSPPPAPAVTFQSMQNQENQYGGIPLVVHESPGILGWWFGLTDAGPKPPAEVDVYLQVGPDAYIPYVWAHCCMPDW